MAVSSEGALRLRCSRRSASATPRSPTDAGCAALAAALDSGALLALEVLHMSRTPASAAAKSAVKEALERTASRAAMPS